MLDKKIQFEEQLLSQPKHFKTWWLYINTFENYDKNYELIERALVHFPFSYKLWYKYLNNSMNDLNDKCPTDIHYQQVNNLFERAIIYMSNKPVIWSLYLKHLMKQRYIIKTIKIFNQALQTLPITQHKDWIWPLYLKFAKNIPITELSLQIWSRYLQLCPNEYDLYIQFLKDKQLYQLAVHELIKSLHKQTNTNSNTFELWKDILNLINEHSTDIEPYIIEELVELGIKKYTIAKGFFSLKLAEYYVRRGLFNHARYIYENAIETCTTVRDFSLLFAAYTKFEETLITTTIQQGISNQQDIELHIERLEFFIDQRELLLNSVLLRQNPHNVHNWLSRIQLIQQQQQQQQQQNDQEIIDLYNKAIATIDIEHCNNAIDLLWISFATFYVEHNDIKNAILIYQQALTITYQQLSSLVNIYCHYIELLCTQGDILKARNILRHDIIVPYNINDTSLTISQCLYQSNTLWCLYVDLEASIGTIDTVSAIYEQMISLQLMSSKNILNYAELMIKNSNYEEAFRIYEIGLELISNKTNDLYIYPIWIIYLKQFLTYYQNTKVERIRYLFQQAINQISKVRQWKIFLLWAKYEEQYGFISNIRHVYETCLLSVDDKYKYVIYKIYIHRSLTLFPLDTRDIYNQAIQHTNDVTSILLAIDYINYEIEQKEYDRARAICQQIAAKTMLNIKQAIYDQFWSLYHTFELSYGTKQSYNQMITLENQLKQTSQYKHIPDQLKQDVHQEYLVDDFLGQLEQEIIQQEG